MKVYVYPCNTNLENPLDCMSDDYVVRETEACDECGHILHLDYDSPFASCECGTREWYK